LFIKRPSPPQKATRLIGARAHTKSALPRLNKFGLSFMHGKTMFNNDFKEFIQSLNDNDVHYLVVGGYAVALHGYPRYTKDLDIWIDRTPANAQKLVTALDKFGFGQLGLSEQDFLGADQIIQLGYPPNRIDLVTDLPGVDFSECYGAKVQILIGETPVNFINLEDLKKNKKASGRHQDLADLENLQ
jgi:hypothetical protein